MTPERIEEIRRLLAKTYPTSSEMIEAREAAKELLAELDKREAER